MHVGGWCECVQEESECVQEESGGGVPHTS